MVLGQIQVPELEGPAHKGPKTLETKRAVRWVRAPVEEQLAEWQIEKRSLQKTIRSQAVRLAEMKRELDIQSVKLSIATERKADDWVVTPPSAAAHAAARADLEAELQQALDQQSSQLRDAQCQLAAMTEVLGARAQEQLDRTSECGAFATETALLRTRIAQLEGDLLDANSRLDKLTSGTINRAASRRLCARAPTPTSPT
jgi:chromosome segregation ATPase